jgi:hypothetical protein
MNYRYIGKKCVFATPGNIFEKSKHGYVFKITDDDWVGVPDWLVEDTDDFEEVNQELEEFKDNLVVWLEDIIDNDENTKEGKRALRAVLEWVNDRRRSNDNC